MFISALVLLVTCFVVCVRANVDEYGRFQITSSIVNAELVTKAEEEIFNKNLYTLINLANGVEKIERGAFSNSRIPEINIYKNANLTIIDAGIFNDLPHLTLLSIGYNGITDIEDGAFQNLPRLKQLGLQGNKIKELRGNMFANLPELEYLNFDDNLITEIEVGAFKNINSKSQLIVSLKNNTLKKISDNVFSNITNVSKLDLSGNEIRTISPTAFQHSPSLTNIVLQDNQISSIPEGTFRDLPNLEELNLDSNKLGPKIKSSFAESIPRSLRVLQLAGNKIEEIEPLFGKNFTNLVELNLQNNSLRKLPDGLLENLINLKKIILKDNSIEEINEFDFKPSPKLTDIDLSNNKISKIAVEALNIPGLILLRLSFNKLTSLQKGQFYIESDLTNVLLDDNEILNIESGAFIQIVPNAENRYLNRLDLSNNKIQKITEGVFNGILFRQVSLSNNNISEIAPKAFENMTKLEYLDLSNNSIKHWKSSDWQNTPYIVADNNLIEELGDGFFDPFINCENCSNLPSLKGNKIRKVSPKVFNNVRHSVNIFSLYLSNNKLKEWDENILNHENLTVYWLDLDDNQLKCLKGDFQKIFKTRTTFLRNNPFKPECLEQIKLWSKDHPDKEIDL